MILIPNMKELVRRLHSVFLLIGAKQLNSLPLIGSTLIIAPHPDDEVIGCGGLISKMVTEGNAPHIAVLTGGEGSHRDCCTAQPKEIIEARRGLTREALKILGVPEENLHELNFKDGSIGKFQEETAALLKLIEVLKPKRILVPHWGEGWPDHLAARELGLKLAPQGTEVWEYCVWMWYYNVWRGLDWKNAVKVELNSEERQLKLKAMDAYIKPLAPCGNPWSGNLPKIFIDANSGKRELYFKVR